MTISKTTDENLWRLIALNANPKMTDDEARKYRALRRQIKAEFNDLIQTLMLAGMFYLADEGFIYGKTREEHQIYGMYPSAYGGFGLLLPDDDPETEAEHKMKAIEHQEKGTGCATHDGDQKLPSVPPVSVN